MTIMLDILLYICCYLIIGMLLTACLAKYDRTTIQSIKEDPAPYILVTLFWPFVIFFAIGYGIFVIITTIFMGLLIYVFRIPLNNPPKEDKKVEQENEPVPIEDEENEETDRIERFEIMDME